MIVLTAISLAILCAIIERCRRFIRSTNRTKTQDESSVNDESRSQMNIIDDHEDRLDNVENSPRNSIPAANNGARNRDLNATKSSKKIQNKPENKDQDDYSPDPPGDTNLLRLLISELECPVCTSAMVSNRKVMICYNGHPCCSLCVPRLSSCPSCRSSHG